MDLRLQRLADNERVFRSLNERIAASGGERLELICECSNEHCSERMVVTRDEYSTVRADDDTFFVRPGHEIPAIEVVVDEDERFLVVRKHAEF
jgi:hypothetical protein